MKLNLEDEEIHINTIQGLVDALEKQYEYVNYNFKGSYIYYGNKPQVGKGKW